EFEVALLGTLHQHGERFLGADVEPFHHLSARGAVALAAGWIAAMAGDSPGQPAPCVPSLPPFTLDTAFVCTVGVSVTRKVRQFFGGVYDLGLASSRT